MTGRSGACARSFQFWKIARSSAGFAEEYPHRVQVVWPREVSTGQEPKAAAESANVTCLPNEVKRKDKARLTAALWLFKHGRAGRERFGRSPFWMRARGAYHTNDMNGQVFATMWYPSKLLTEGGI